MDLAPGVYLRESAQGPAPELGTGVPAFLGSGGPAEVLRLDRWSVEAAAKLRGYLRFAVRGFFANGGRRCYVVPSRPAKSLAGAQGVLEHTGEVDLVCAPELGTATTSGLLEGQFQLLSLCAALGDCFAILDSPSAAAAGHRGIEGYRAALARGLAMVLAPYNGALYYPWVKVRGVCSICGGSGLSSGSSAAQRPACSTCNGSGAGSADGLVPPCGHIAGIYSATDASTGVFKAPANAVVEDAIDLAADVPAALQGDLNARGINCLRAFPDRGIRVWGARTLGSDRSYRYVNQRRLVLTLGRWLRQAMAQLVFEPNNQLLWLRSNRAAVSVLRRLFEGGAFSGSTEAEAFYVKCDAETNPPEARAAGQVVTEIGIVAVAPAELIKIQIVQGQNGVTVTEQP